MRVNRPGTLMYHDGQLTIRDWAFGVPEMGNGETRSITPADHKAVIRTCLLYLAGRYHIDLGQHAADPVPTLDVERATLDAIAMARWPERNA